MKNIYSLTYSFSNMFYKLLNVEEYSLEDFTKDWHKYQEYAKEYHLEQGVDVTDMSLWLRFTTNDCYTLQNVLNDWKHGGANKDFLIEKVQDCISLNTTNEIQIYYS